MTKGELIIFSLVQGLGEFLPISSSGHLLLLKKLLGLESIPLFFDIMLHIATLMAIFVFYYARIVSLWKTFWQFLLGGWKVKVQTSDTYREDLGLLLFILVATFFTGLIGLGVKGSMDIWSNGRWVYVFFLVTVCFLTLAHFVSKKKQGSLPDTWKKWAGLAVIVGLLQGFGTLPGISRSGITIAGLLLLGFPRIKTTEISFLISVPAILGALFLELKTGVDWALISSLMPTSWFAMAMVLTFLVGYISLKWLQQFVITSKLVYFSIYLVIIAIWGLLQS